MNYVHPDDAAAYYAMSPEEQQADVERHIDWFRKHGEHIVGGEELDEPAGSRRCARAARARESS